MRSKRSHRYKKKKNDLFLILKITLICYLTIYGVGYMTSDTSAYFSNQSEVTQIFTASTWEVYGCGEESTIDEVSSDRTEFNSEDKDGNSNMETGNEALTGEENNVEPENTVDIPVVETGNDGLSGEGNNVDPENTVDNPIEETETDAISDEENNVDPENPVGNPIEKTGNDVLPGEKNNVDPASDCDDEADVTIEIVEEETADEKDCNNEDGSLLLEENEKDTSLSTEVKGDCKDKEDKAHEENEDNKAVKVEEKTEQKNEKQNEIENTAEKENEEKVNVDDSQKSNDESQQQPDSKDESVNESNENNPTDQNSTKDEASKNSIEIKTGDEMNDAVKQEKSIEKAEGDTNE